LLLLQSRGQQKGYFFLLKLKLYEVLKLRKLKLKRDI
jgi:hypothetical protein